MRQVTITPKYQIGSLVEAHLQDAIHFGIIRKVTAFAEWNDKVNGELHITYYLTDKSNPFVTVKEKDINRVVEEK